MRRLSLPLLAMALLAPAARADDPPRPIKLLIITGDNIGAHDWKGTTQSLRDSLSAQGRVNVEVTATPADDLTDENLAKYDALLLNYRDTAEGGPKTKWSDANKAAFLKAVKGGKGLVVVHWASASFTKPNWDEFEKAIAGGWRSQGFHGPAHEFTVKATAVEHPISKGLPSKFNHVKDELYQNSMLPPGSIILATAYSDPKLPKGTDKDEPVVWVNTYGEGRVFNTVLGHDVAAHNDPNVQAWIKRGVEWAATGRVAEPAQGDVARAGRWMVDIGDDVDVEEHARRLEALGIELAVPIGGKKLAYLSAFTGDKPARREEAARMDKRLYVSPTGRERDHDVTLLKKGGFDAEPPIILEFFPEALSETMSRLELAYDGRQRDEIRRTCFRVRGVNGTYSMEVRSQTLRP